MHTLTFNVRIIRNSILLTLVFHQCIPKLFLNEKQSAMHYDRNIGIGSTDTLLEPEVSEMLPCKMKCMELY